ncbi:unnamed protein product, partial [marine sediment metagenome]
MSELDFQKFSNRLRKDIAAQTATAVVSGTQSPNEAAEAIIIGQDLRLSPDVVLAAPDIFRQRQMEQAATTALDGAPKTQAWLRNNSINGPLAKDDLENLTWFEKHLAPTIEALGGGNDPIASISRKAGAGIQRFPAYPKVKRAFTDQQTINDIGKSVEDIYQEILSDLGTNALPSMRATARQTAQARFEMVDGLGPEDADRMRDDQAVDISDARSIFDAAAKV